jgi:hypothetical protein
VGALLHGAIVVLLGLPSFGLAMIGLLALSYGGAMVRPRGLLGRRSPTKVSHHDDTPDHD